MTIYFVSKLIKPKIFVAKISDIRISEFTVSFGESVIFSSQV